MRKETLHSTAKGTLAQPYCSEYFLSPASAENARLLSPVNAVAILSFINYLPSTCWGPDPVLGSDWAF